MPSNLNAFLKDSYGYLKCNVRTPAVGLLLSEQGTGGNSRDLVEYWWGGIRTLHKTAVGAAQLTIPLFSPFCGF